MNTTHRLDRTTQPKLEKLAARTVLAGGLGMAVMGLTAAMANADPMQDTPSPTPTITATLNPAPPAPAGQREESGPCNADVEVDKLPPLGC